MWYCGTEGGLTVSHGSDTLVDVSQRKVSQFGAFQLQLTPSECNCFYGTSFMHVVHDVICITGVQKRLFIEHFSQRTIVAIIIWMLL